MPPPLKKCLTGICVVILPNNCIGWIYQYDNHPHEAVAIPLDWAKRFVEVLQEKIAYLETHPSGPPPTTVDGLSMGDTATVQVLGPDN
jgi:hypothetical protein